MKSAPKLVGVFGSAPKGGEVAPAECPVVEQGDTVRAKRGVSSGDPSGNRAEGVRGPVLLEELDAASYVPDGRPEIDEIHALPVALFASLPAATSLDCWQRGHPFRVTTSRAAHADAIREGVPVLVGGELMASALGIERGRFASRAFARLLEAKRANAHARLTSEAALDGLRFEGRPSITIGEWCEALGVRIRCATVHA